MREEQVSELNESNQRIVGGAIEALPLYCTEECQMRNFNCAAGWIIDTVLYARRLEDFPEEYNYLKIRRLNNEIKKIPLLQEKANQCEIGVRMDQSGPIELKLIDLNVQPDYYPQTARSNLNLSL